MSDDKNLTWKTTITEELSEWNSVKGSFEAQVFDGQVIDTNVQVDVKFVLVWDEKEKFMKELAELIKKYHI